MKHTYHETCGNVWTILGSVEVWRIISPCYPGDGDMEELLGPASRDHASVNLLMGDLGLDTAFGRGQGNKVGYGTPRV